MKNPTNNSMANISAENLGTLDMVIAFDTTGSMSAYIDDVRAQVADLVPRLFNENPDLRIGIVAFGDYCDMAAPTTFGKAYQALPLTDDKAAIIQFVRSAQRTGGGDADEFYELVLKKILCEMPWRKEAAKSIILIADADPREVGYVYPEYQIHNDIDWREVARQAAAANVRIDTVSILGRPWYHELSQITNGVCIPFTQSRYTSQMVEASILSRGSASQRERFDSEMAACSDPEMSKVWFSLKSRRDETDIDV